MLAAYLLFLPQFDTTMSSRPSPSKSPVVTPCHHPVSSLRRIPSPLGGEREFATATGGFQSRNWPPLLRKIFIGPHSHASTNSGWPSPSKSLKTAPLTKPICSH